MKSILFFVIALLLAAGGIYVLQRDAGFLSGEGSLITRLRASLFSGDSQETVVKVDEQVEQQEIISASESDTSALRYTHPIFGFSFNKPEGFIITSTAVWGDSEVLVVESANADKKERGFQIFITPHDEPAISEERVRIDLPDIVIKNIQQATLDGADALVFTSVDSSLGDTYEVWFVHGGRLYQIMTYADNGAALNALLDTWKFTLY